MKALDRIKQDAKEIWGNWLEVPVAWKIIVTLIAVGVAGGAVTSYAGQFATKDELHRGVAPLSDIEKRLAEQQSDIEAIKANTVEIRSDLRVLVDHILSHRDK